MITIENLSKELSVISFDGKVAARIITSENGHEVRVKEPTRSFVLSTETTFRKAVKAATAHIRAA